MLRTLSYCVILCALAAPAITARGEDNAAANNPNRAVTAPAKFDDSPFEARELPKGVGEVISDQHDQQSVSAKVFLQGPAFIREQRQIGLPDGRVRLVLQDLPSEIDTSSVRIDSEHNAELIGSSYTAGDLSKEQLLNTHTGDMIFIQTACGEGASDWQQARLLAFDADYLIVVLNDKAQAIPRTAGLRVAFPKLSAGLHGRPTVELDLDSERGGTKPVSLTYRSAGLTWQPHYHIIVAPGEDKLHLELWGRIENHTGIDFRGIELNLRGAASSAYRPSNPRQFDGIAARQSRQPSGRLATSLDKQQELLNGRSYNFKLASFEIDELSETYSFSGNAAAHQSIEGEIAAAKLLSWTTQRPIPGGLADIFSGPDGQFEQRSQLTDTASGELVKLPIGNSEAVTVTRKLKAAENLTNNSSASEIGWTTVITNHSDKPKEVELNEIMPEDLHGKWVIVESSLEPDRKTSNFAQWQIEVGGDEQKTLYYRFRFND